MPDPAPQPARTVRRTPRQRRRRNIIALIVMLAVAGAGLIAVGLNAGRWGVPGFTFTNEQGSHCRNRWLGHECSTLTLADVQSHVRADLPEGTRLLSGTWRQTHDYELVARLVYPRAGARAGWEALTEKYGACHERVPSPLDLESGLSGLCVMTNLGGFAAGTAPDSEVWRVATATQADGDTVVDLLIRSR
ncbi:MAG: hypothetical protein Q4G46_07235 [Propionibacteriaceae bacterium]|nr:hypothetical protein [Propionibacteriaceae bacterium]